MLIDISHTFIGHERVLGRIRKGPQRLGAIAAIAAAPLIGLYIAICLERRFHLIQCRNAAHSAAAAFMNVLQVNDATIALC